MQVFGLALRCQFSTVAGLRTRLALNIHGLLVVQGVPTVGCQENGVSINCFGAQERQKLLDARAAFEVEGRLGLRLWEV